MSLLALLLAATLQSSDMPAATPPQDWTALPELRFRRRPDAGPPLSAFVRDEIRGGRCATAAGSASLSINLAVLVAPDGRVRRIVPQAIDCPTVEQYAAGLILRMARDNLVADAVGDGWFRTGLTFAWVQ